MYSLWIHFNHIITCILENKFQFYRVRCFWKYKREFSNNTFQIFHHVSLMNWTFELRQFLSHKLPKQAIQIVWGNIFGLSDFYPDLVRPKPQKEIFSAPSLVSDVYQRAIWNINMDLKADLCKESWKLTLEFSHYSECPLFWTLFLHNTPKSPFLHDFNAS